MAKLGNQGQVFKGEKSFNDLSSYAASTIKDYLSDMIYDSSVLLVVISPAVAQSSWVDWEIGYALRNSTRAGRTSKRNGIICVVQKGSYTGNSSWAFDYNCNVNIIFLPTKIVRNMQATYGPIDYYSKANPDYCIIVSESTFMANPEKYIEVAYERSTNEYTYPRTLK